VAALWFLAGYALTVVAHFGFWPHLPTIIASDTIWHLRPIERFILVAIVFVLAALLSIACMLKTLSINHRYSWWHANNKFRVIFLGALDFTVSVLLFWIGVSFAPQLFYLFYTYIFNYLPVQWVAYPIGLGEFVSLFVINQSDNLRTLVTGVVLQSILISSTLIWLYIALGLKAESHQA